VTLDRVRQMVGGTLAGRRVLLLGISYRQDVGDTRYSPSETFVRAAVEAGADVVAHDPLVDHWDELDRDVPDGIPSPEGFDAVVFAVPHDAYRSMDLPAWLGDARPAVFDGFSVLTTAQRRTLASLGCDVASIGRGDVAADPS
jgi:UDP-N-acetyl-D-mannosaminuronate dehydrogenase